MSEVNGLFSRWQLFKKEVREDYPEEQVEEILAEVYPLFLKLNRKAQPYRDLGFSAHINEIFGALTLTIGYKDLTMQFFPESENWFCHYLDGMFEASTKFRLVNALLLCTIKGSRAYCSEEEGVDHDTFLIQVEECVRLLSWPNM